ncbi:ABC transporter substrate-binding protein [Sporolactobacillus terrae]|uniref:Peptide ABC transporter substrate-binding protein n=1 Tax=Sporolactobacillus terrae TaxID=269673 RepID=A0ABX5Q4R7_9BACL|nr:ABC transporter substrate-binding protein [Sporolactobacillus terrae]QAA21624.1 peptide ABC transporter substrate-binding protein [Sporolactobacillus terrae]QAA24596.1 peptide ABC transporter substrate-binding protein [Sporolactobacillus terrae]UAK16433.1 ABC transporter substrate-binding protein [Sporolactobacillus terrae]
MKKVFALLIVTCLLVLTACGGKSTTSSDTGKATDGGTLKIGLSSNIASLDPIGYTSTYESNVMRSIFDTLVKYNQDNSKIIPSLAKSWSVSKDNKTYTFYLRTDVHFQKGKYQDGRAMTASDVKYSLERSLNKSAMNRIRDIKKINVINDHKLEIQLETPYAAFLAMLTDMGNAIVPKEEVKGWGDKFGMHPVGTGAFTFEKWSADSYVLVKRNTNYWGPKPHLDAVKFSIIGDPNTMSNSLASGDIDVATNLQGASILTVKKNKNLNFVSNQGLQVSYLSFNFKSGPTKDLKVRQAIKLAMDKDELLKGSFKYGGASVADLPLPRASWGYDQKLADQNKEKMDIAKAKSLLKEAGYPNGFTTDVYVVPARVPIATIFQSQMKKIGVKVNIKSVEWGTFSDTASKAKAPMYIMSWSWYPDPDFFLYQMFHSKQIGALGNGGSYSNKKLDALLTKATSETTDQTKRKEIYGQALEIINHDIPHVNLFDQNVVYGTSKKVHGFEISPDGSISVANDQVNAWLSK